MSRKRFWRLTIEDDADRPHVAPDVFQRADPVLRGYWLDEEVMAIAGIESASVIMKMKWAGAVHPSHIAIKPKGRKRAWSARNVLRAVLVAEFARCVRVSFHTAARIIKAAGLDHLDRQIGTDRLLREVEIAIEGTDATTSDTWFSPSALPSAQIDAAIVVDDWQVVSWEEGGKEPQPLVRVSGIETREPTVKTEVRPYTVANPVRLTIPIGRVVPPFLDSLAQMHAPRNRVS